MTRPSGRTAAIAALVCVLADLGGRVRAADGQGVPPSTTPFRVAVDLIPVEVQVVDREGQPVAGLTVERFEVTIGGRRRRVVSAEFVGSTEVQPASPTPGPSSSSSSSVRPAMADPHPLGQKRIVILAVDAASMNPSSVRPVLLEAAAFIRRLAPADEVGLFAYPAGPVVAPTADHDAVIRALDTIVARRDGPPPGRFNLSPAELVELSREFPKTSEGQALEAQLCPDPETSRQCVLELRAEVTGQVLMYEGLAFSARSTLQGLMADLAKVPDRKTLVLVSGGIVSGDRPGTRPDTRWIGQEVGRLAARANVNVYALYLDDQRATMAAEARRAPTSPSLLRDVEVVGGLLADLSGAAGGSFLRVTSGNSASAFERLRAETSAYYLLGVEPLPADRDGRPHELGVKVGDRNVQVRSRSWVVIPRAETAPGATARAAAPASPPAPDRLVPPTPPAIRMLADAFDRDDGAPMTAALAARNADGLLEAFRGSESPWPASPRRTAAFALDLAVAGLRTDSSFTRDAAFRLLAEYAVRIRQGGVDDPFECAWFWTATAGLQGIFSPEAGSAIVERAVDRCPGNSRLTLARAVVGEQQLVIVQGGATARIPAGPVTEAERRVLELYDAAAAFPATKYEARVRAAYLHYRAGRHTDGLALLTDLPDPPDEAQVRYLGELVRGQLLRAAGRTVEADQALRAALVTWPGAQAARVALTSLLVSRGESDAAAALAASVLTSPDTNGDPWWVYYFGDYRAYAEIRRRLRELAR